MRSYPTHPLSLLTPLTCAWFDSPPPPPMSAWFVVSSSTPCMCVSINIHIHAYSADYTVLIYGVVNRLQTMQGLIQYGYYSFNTFILSLLSSTYVYPMTVQTKILLVQNQISSDRLIIDIIISTHLHVSYIAKHICSLQSLYY